MYVCNTYIHTMFSECLESLIACGYIGSNKTRTGNLDILQFETFHRCLSNIELCVLYSEHMIGYQNSGWDVIAISSNSCITFGKNLTRVSTPSIVTDTTRKTNITLSDTSNSSLKMKKNDLNYTDSIRFPFLIMHWYYIFSKMSLIFNLHLEQELECHLNQMSQVR